MANFDGEAALILTASRGDGRATAEKLGDVRATRTEAVATLVAPDQQALALRADGPAMPLMSRHSKLQTRRQGSPVKPFRGKAASCERRIPLKAGREEDDGSV